jgi:hypothetical protein
MIIFRIKGPSNGDIEIKVGREDFSKRPKDFEFLPENMGKTRNGHGRCLE